MVEEKKQPGLAADNFTGTGPGGLDPVAFAKWYRAAELEQWERLDFKAIEEIAGLLEKAEQEDAQVFVMGNGGSAATASHIATDWAKTAERAGKPLLRCTSLNDNVAFMSAIGNDLGYEKLFVRQLENVLNAGDLVVLISGSGNSPNVIEAAAFAREKGASVVAFTGFSGGKLRTMSDVVFHVDSDQYGVIEDMHMAVGSILAFYLKQRH
ncbi:MAG: SIS domain-containing protein [Gammaproteobacteria bacterium]|nr:SIS domain-containing protein [Gammaproteobacteria bacterium]MDP6617234.1 SIS domain-containing protein [Gammaproteobacteria bacterium]MDP6695821.1 SIS domain-containing protein [Gammaproteobacteria bacterium]